jgi:tetratricopeptide (TPR) repeat protein
LLVLQKNDVRMLLQTVPIRYFLLWIQLTTLLSSCQIYHNITARYNGYFLAKEKMLEAETALATAQQDNYNEILQVYTKIDTLKTASQKGAFEYVVKTASIPIQRHPTSKWKDYCYLLIGKARLYMGDFTNATNTFKYVNTESSNADARHQALNWLLRSFIEMEEWRNAEYVASFMSQEPLISIENARDFYLNMAHYHRTRNQYAPAAAYLEKALPDVKKKEMKRRVLFILAQIYEKLGDNNKAYTYYNELLRSNPNYDMEFVAKLSASGTVDFSNPDAIEKGEKYLEKLLKDDKNIELKDKIYLKMAIFERNRKEYNKAIEFLEEAIFYSKSNSVKADAFAQMGDIYHDNLHNIEKSSASYDSALTLADKKAENYKAIERKHRILQKLAKPYLNVQQAERLLLLAEMDDSERNQYITTEIAKEKQAIDNQIAKESRRQEQRKKEQALLAVNQSNANNFNATNAQNNTINTPNTLPSLTSGGGTFYFYNANQVQNGKTEFFKTWGERPPVDNWRLLSRIPASAQSNFKVNDYLYNTTSTLDSGKNISKTKPEDLKYASVRPKAARLAEIPDSKAGKDSLKRIMQENLFLAGKIAYEDLLDYPKTIGFLEKFVNQYAPTNNTPEALYILQKICAETKSCDATIYQQRLREKFAKSVYTKLLDNKNALSNSQKDNAEAEKLYMTAYTAYQLKDYAQAQTALTEIQQKYGENSYQDKISLLQAMILAKTSADKTAIEQALTDFLELYKDSELKGFAEKMLATLKGNR